MKKENRTMITCKRNIKSPYKIKRRGIFLRLIIIATLVSLLGMVLLGCTTKPTPD